MRVYRYYSTALLVTGLLCLSLCQFGRQNFSAGAQTTQTTGDKVSRANYQQSEEFYLGSSTTKFGPHAWFLSLDLATRRGKLYARPQVLDLTEFQVSETGHITFRTERGLGEVLYQFEGDQGPKGITGRFKFISAERNTEQELVTTDAVVLEKVSLAVQKPPQSRDVSGIYTNVRYNEESGDLNGEELILFWNGKELQGVFLLYEDMEPVAMSNVSLSSANLSFRVPSLGGELTYQATLSGNRLQLRRTDANAHPYFSNKRILLKKGDVRSAFQD